MGGILSDHLRQRRLFVITGSVGMAAALALFIGWPIWPGPLIAQLLFGAFHGLHATAVAAMTAPPLNIANTQALGGASLSLRSKILVNAKHKPAIRANQSARVCGQGQEASGVLRIIMTPTKAKPMRHRGPALGFSPKRGHASNMTHAGIR
jgi:hypothetical protein